MRINHKRIKVRPYPRLRAEAVKVFHKWIVNRDFGICFTCGAPGNQCGHWIHRNCMDFLEQGNHCQCPKCNLYLSGNLAVYTMKMINLYGYDQCEIWRIQSNEPIKFSREFLEDIIKKYGVASEEGV